ncbi:MAG: hypothetical protein ABH828_02090 [archaeon]
MNNKIMIIFLILLFPLNVIASIDYLDEFSIDGRNCLFVDEFDYISTYNRVSVMGCCDLEHCFYVPLNINKQTVFTNDFHELLQIESARQNLFKNDLSNQVFLFKGYFDFCELISLESPEKQVVGGIVDVSDKALPYLINVEKASDVRKTVSTLQKTRVLSKFNVGTFILSSACSFGNNVEEDMLILLSDCHNSFQRIKYGPVDKEELSVFNQCVSELKMETTKQEGFIGELEEISYMISSILTGGNIIDFIRNQIPIFENYVSLFHEQVIDRNYSATEFNGYVYFLDFRVDSFKDSLKDIKRNFPFFKRVTYFFGFGSHNEVYEHIEPLKDLSKQITSAQKHYQYKTVHSLLDDAFIKLNHTYFYQQSEYSLKKELVCYFNETFYEILEPAKELQESWFNKTVLVSKELDEPKVEFFGANGQRCEDNVCKVEFMFKNGGNEAFIDFNVTLEYRQQFTNNTLQFETLFEDKIIKEQMDEFEEKINLNTNLSNLELIGVENHGITIKPNEFYTYKDIPYPNISIVTVNKTVIISTKRIYCLTED